MYIRIISISVSTCHLVIHTLVVSSISRVGVANTSRRLQVYHIGLCSFVSNKQTALLTPNPQRTEQTTEKAMQRGMKKGQELEWAASNAKLLLAVE